MKHVTLMFLFNHDMSKVLLIRNRKDKSLYGGLWNGLGGKVEEQDIDARDSVRREVWEETNMLVSTDSDLTTFERVQVIEFVKWGIKMHVYYGVLKPDYKYNMLNNLRNDEGMLRWWRPSQAIAELNDERGIPQFLMHILGLEGRFNPLWKGL